MPTSLETPTRTRMSRAIVISDNAAIDGRLRSVLGDIGVTLDRRQPHVAVIVQGAAGPTSQVHAARREHPDLPLIYIATSGSEAIAVAAFRAGVAEYLNWPFEQAEIEAVWRRLSPPPAAAGGGPLLHGDSDAIRATRARVARLAATGCNVLVAGETGTGKELVASLLHRASARRDKPFVSINCSAVPETLFESELFGFERGAFTGALTTSRGRLRQANGGTVFLDEIGELTLAVQPKLLRAIEQREIQPLGSRRADAIDVRFVCATNRDLAELCRQGFFRADLFYRLNVCTVSIPPLRDRREDIPVLAARFAAEIGRAYGRPDAAFTDAAVALLEAYDWPGNVRELRNVVENSLIESDGPVIGTSALPPSLRGRAFRLPPDDTLERHRLIETLREVGGNKSAAAQRLHWSRMTIYRKLARFKIGVTEM